jgi:hypothetical protein
MSSTEQRYSVGSETDLEPDDVMANYFLNKFADINYSVVGEGSAKIKYARMTEYCKQLGSNATVLCGQDSKKEFKNDGAEFSNLNVTNVSYDKNQYVETVKKYIENSNNPIIVFLKPPRELIDNLETLKPYLSKATAYFYGGFNFRCIMWQYNKEIILEMLNSFKSVQIYETFHATGSNNSLNQNDKEVYDAYFQNKNNAYIDTLTKLTNLWNTHLVADCVKTCEKHLTNKQDIDTVFADLETTNDSNIREHIGKYVEAKNIEQFYRNYKCRNSIKGNEDFQYVMADMCAVIAFFSGKFSDKLVSCDVEILENGYTKYTPNENSKISYFSGINRDDMLAEVAKMLSTN